MRTSYIDIHPHIISDDDERYPPAPLFGERLAWSTSGASTVEALIRNMDAAGIGKAAVVHSSTTYGFDNSYALDSCARFPDRLAAVGSVDVLAPDAVETIERLVERGLKGLRLFTGASASHFDTGPMEDPRADPAFDLCSRLGLSLCVYTAPVGLPGLAALAGRFPALKVVLDHLGRPDLADGPPYARAQGLFDLARQPNVHLKLSTRSFEDASAGQASASSFFPRLVEAFGARRLVWGSNIPMSPGSLSDVLAIAKTGLESLSEEDRTWIFARTAQALYPSLAD